MTTRARYATKAVMNRLVEAARASGIVDPVPMAYPDGRVLVLPLAAVATAAEPDAFEQWERGRSA